MAEEVPGNAGGDAAPKSSEPAKITLTQAELDGQIEAARKTVRDEANAAKAAADAETQRKADEQKGEWEKLAKERADELATLKAEKVSRERADGIRNAVASAGKDAVTKGYTPDVLDRYVTKALLTDIPADAKPDDVKKAAKDAVEQFVKDNPRQPQRQAGVQSVGGRFTAPDGKAKPDPKADPLGATMAQYTGPRLPSRN